MKNCVRTIKLEQALIIIYLVGNLIFDLKTMSKRHFVTYSRCPNRLREDSYLNFNISVLCQALNKTDRLRQCQRVHTKCQVEEFKPTEIKAMATHFDLLNGSFC